MLEEMSNSKIESEAHNFKSSVYRRKLFFVSSAKFNVFSISYMYQTNKGSRIDPWGIPCLTSFVQVLFIIEWGY